MNKPVRLVAESAPDTAFTVRDYLQMYDTGAFRGMRVELVGGELRKMMPSGFSHGELNGMLYAKLLTAYAGTGKRLAIDLMIAIDPKTLRGADIAVVLPDVPMRGPVPADRFVLIVEIAATTLGEDLGDKLAEYARVGVPDYWVADVEAQVMHVMHSPEGDRYRERSVVPFDTQLAVPGTSATIIVD